MTGLAGLGIRFAAHFEFQDRFARERAAVERLELRPDSRNSFGDGTTEMRRRREAVDHGQFVIDPPESIVAVQERDANRSVSLECVEQRQRFGRRLLRPGSRRGSPV